MFFSSKYQFNFTNFQLFLNNTNPIHWICWIFSNSIVPNAIICNILEPKTQNSLKNSSRHTNSWKQHTKPTVTFFFLFHCTVYMNNQINNNKKNHSTCHSCMCLFLKINVYARNYEQCLELCLHCTMLAAQVNSMRDVVGQQRDRKQHSESERTAAFVSIKRFKWTLRCKPFKTARICDCIWFARSQVC